MKSSLESEIVTPAQSDSAEPSGHDDAVFISSVAPSHIDWKELARYRELFATLVWRDISVKYKQTFFGFMWALLRPICTIAVLTIVFGQFAKLPPVADKPYILLVCTGLLPWLLISLSLNEVAESLVNNSAIITKVYFPRLILPLAALFSGLLDFLISLFILIGFVAWFGAWPGWQILFLPIFTALALIVAFGPGLLLASLNVKYRDFRYVIPFFMQLGLYLSPVGFSLDVVPDHWRMIYSLNPAVGVIEGFRWCLFGQDMQVYWPAIMLSLLFSVLFGWLGLQAFRSAEATFADRI